MTQLSGKTAIYCYITGIAFVVWGAFNQIVLIFDWVFMFGVSLFLSIKGGG